MRTEKNILTKLKRRLALQTGGVCLRSHGRKRHVTLSNTKKGRVVGVENVREAVF